MTIDFSRDAPASIHVMELPLSFVASRTGICHGIGEEWGKFTLLRALLLDCSFVPAAAWFDVTFRGSTTVAVLPTGPTSPGTHWC